MDKVMSIVKIIDHNLKEANTLNYPTVVRTIVRETIKITKEKQILEGVGITLHTELWDTYELSMRDETKWNSFYNNIVKTELTSILEINKKTQDTKTVSGEVEEYTN